MKVYFDTSALIKRYVNEKYSEDVRVWFLETGVISTCMMTRADLPAGVNRLHRTKFLDESDYSRVLQEFRTDWVTFHRIPITEQIVARADLLTCQFVLRGYDAIHLACALTWQEALREPITFATFDSQLSEAAKQAGLSVLPE
jgi:predicted nucleic acid-binding protein